MEFFYKPFLLDVTTNRGSLLVYACYFHLIFKLDLLNKPEKEKYFVIDIYKLQAQKSYHFLNILTVLLGLYLTQYDNKAVLGEFDLKPNNLITLDFLNDYDFKNLVKCNTCFKGVGSSIDVTLTYHKYLFKFSTTFETEVTIILFYTLNVRQKNSRKRNQKY